MIRRIAFHPLSLKLEWIWIYVSENFQICIIYFALLYIFVISALNLIDFLINIC